MKCFFNEVLTESEGAKQPITEWTTERKMKKKNKRENKEQLKNINSNTNNCKKTTNLLL